MSSKGEFKDRSFALWANDIARLRGRRLWLGPGALVDEAVLLENLAAKVLWQRVQHLPIDLFTLPLSSRIVPKVVDGWWRLFDR